MDLESTITDHDHSVDANKQTSDGTTPSERYLTRLARQSFLSLWSHSNLFTDEGRKNGKGDGKELCDLLVVFDKHVLIFSDKHCEFGNLDKLEISWGRWYRRAVERSVRQILGAQSWITRFPSRIFLDKSCRHAFPLQLPPAHEIRFHLIAVTGGANAACKDTYGNESTGSLIINTSVIGSDHEKYPFTIGHVQTGSQYIHVLDELTLNVVLQELDTIRDLVDYLERKEIFLSHQGRTVIATGEEQLVAMYLTNIDKLGHHNFIDVADNVDILSIQEGHWEKFIRNPQYLAKKQADEVSYAWDELIEHFIQYGEVGLAEDKKRDVYAMEPALRVLAAESRLSRRQNASYLIDAFNKKIQPGQRFLRLGYSKKSPDVAYVFLVVPYPPWAETYEEYRDNRRALLLASCKVAPLSIGLAPRVVGIAAEPGLVRGATEDLVMLEARKDFWNSELEEEARNLQKQHKIFLSQNMKCYETHEDEYPDLPISFTAKTPGEKLLERARLRRLKGIKLRRRKL